MIPAGETESIISEQSVYGYSETVYITHLPIQKVDDYFIDGSARSLQIWSYTPGKCEGLSEGMKEQC